MNRRSFIIYLVLLSAFSTSILCASGQTFANSLSDCQDLQRLFDYTYYRDGLNNIEKYPYGNDYELVSCNSPGKCPDGVVRTVCQWQRFLSFHCKKVGTTTYYEIATNGLPNHCYIATANQPAGSSLEYNAYYFSGVFNLPIKSMSSYNLIEPFYEIQINS